MAHLPYRRNLSTYSQYLPVRSKTIALIFISSIFQLNQIIFLLHLRKLFSLSLLNEITTIILPLSLQADLGTLHCMGSGFS